jgi:hypothetical protein
MCGFSSTNEMRSGWGVGLAFVKVVVVLVESVFLDAVVGVVFVVVANVFGGVVVITFAVAVVVVLVVVVLVVIVLSLLLLLLLLLLFNNKHTGRSSNISIISVAIWTQDGSSWISISMSWMIVTPPRMMSSSKCFGTHALA